MGFDYYCPQCKGPAYRTENYDPKNPSSCEACCKGWPTSYVCSWCQDECTSTVRYGGEMCKTKKYFGKNKIFVGTCQNMICDTCSKKNKEFCKSCYENNRTLQETLLDLENELTALNQKIAKVKRKIEKSTFKERKIEKSTSKELKIEKSTSKEYKANSSNDSGNGKDTRSNGSDSDSESDSESDSDSDRESLERERES